MYSLDTPEALHSFYGPETSEQAQRFQYSEVLTYFCEAIADLALIFWPFLACTCKCSANQKEKQNKRGCLFLLKNTFFNIHGQFWVTKYSCKFLTLMVFHQAIQLWIYCSLNHLHDKPPVQMFIFFFTEHSSVKKKAFEGGFYLTAIIILFLLISLVCSCSPPLELVFNVQFLAAYCYYYVKYWSQSIVNT